MIRECLSIAVELSFKLTGLKRPEIMGTPDPSTKKMELHDTWLVRSNQRLQSVEAC